MLILHPWRSSVCVLAAPTLTELPAGSLPKQPQESSGGWPQALGLYTHVADLEEALGARLRTNPALALAAL